MHVPNPITLPTAECLPWFLHLYWSASSIGSPSRSNTRTARLPFACGYKILDERPEIENRTKLLPCPKIDRMRTAFWTAARDDALKQMKADGLSASEIAVRLGVTRNMVIGRSNRLRGTIYRSEIKRNSATMAKSAHRREQLMAREKSAMERLRADLAQGRLRDEAVREAFESGARLRSISAELGLTFQRIQQIVHKRSLSRVRNQCRVGTLDIAS